eukprot:TRINITY_DN13751_c0_g1_i1.p1 TRINITY_DN13751_c0_g1~~TRINITY_DN13751_c0_g1_i1.p1  ORF type:complete len:330 (+),score=77.35 TRINITY_DN13751_c0_g1_i1:216-1205(+)
MKGPVLSGEVPQMKGPVLSGVKDDLVDLPPVSVFAAPPVAAIDLLEEQEDVVGEGLSEVVSEIIGLSEVQIANLTPEELIVHVEKRIRSTEQFTQAAAPVIEADAPMAMPEEQDLPPLPPLPTPTVSTLVQGIPLDNVYSYLTELQKAAREDGIEVAQEIINDEEALDDNNALAFVKVLREAGLAYFEGKPMGYPKIDPPRLPPGFTSWVVQETTEEKASRLRKERQQRDQQLARKAKRQTEYAKQLKVSAANKKFEQHQADKFRSLKLSIGEKITRLTDADEVKEGAIEYLQNLDNMGDMETIAQIDPTGMDPGLAVLHHLLASEFKS